MAEHRKFFPSICRIIFKIMFVLLKMDSLVCEDKCDIHATIIRHIENEGFHREVRSLVEIVSGNAAFMGDCQIVLEETLPSGLYVNPDQLAELRRFKQVEACPVGRVDIETSQLESTPHIVHVYSTLQRTENLFSAPVSLPFHLRYHSPMEKGGYARAIMGSPSLLLRCSSNVDCKGMKSVEAPCGPCDSNKCHWLNIFYKTNSPNIVVKVPVGNLGHTTLVTMFTLLVTSGGCVYIWSALLASTLKTKKNKKKS